MTSHTAITEALDWDMVATPIPGEESLGDRAVVVFTGGRALIAAVDGLGHGREAAAAAQVASAVLERSAGQEPVAAVLECHRALRYTRGVALSVASIDIEAHTMTWVGVGNVEGRLLRSAGQITATESLLLHGGIVGHELPKLSSQTTTIARGDVLIFATDGVRRDFADVLVPSGPCRSIAQDLVDRYSLGSDDTLVVVVRYLARR